VLKQFSVGVSLFYAGPLYGVTEAHVVKGHGNLHVIRSGPVEVRHDDQPSLYIVEPSLLLYPRPLKHRFRTDEHAGAEFTCATLTFSAGHLNPFEHALPSVLAVPLAELPGMQGTVDLLFDEVAGQGYGRKTTVDLLFEVLLIQLLRKIIEEGTMSDGMLAGLAHPQLSRALVALHEAPSHAWTLESLAALAGMSRSRFANTFKATMGSTTGDYLCRCRMALAQDLLRRDTPLKRIATEVGYGSSVALTRVFKARLGMTPRDWVQSEHAASRA